MNPTAKPLFYFFSGFLAALAIVVVFQGSRSPGYVSNAPASVFTQAAVTHTQESGQVAALTQSAGQSAVQYYPVVKVVDGDTIDVAMNGQKERVRLLGVNTPETVDPRKPVQCYGPQASAVAKQELTGVSVDLQADPSQGNTDKYGRLLRYVFLADGTDFDEWLIANGYGFEYTYDKPYEYQAVFKAAQAEAQANKVGLWAADTCNGELRALNKKAP